MNARELSVERLLSGRRAQRGAKLRIEGERIAAVEAAAPGEGSGLLALPALANAHDHARAVKPVALGAFELPLELWLPPIPRPPRVGPYAIAAGGLRAPRPR